jgi:PPM family protein phosphatase
VPAPIAFAHAAAATECGRRRLNQDAVLLVTLRDGTEIAAVADGMGGNAGGEVASALALQTLRAELDAGTALGAAIRSANRAILDEAAARPELAGMGTTLVALLRRGARYVVANVGDSRAYRIDAQGIAQLTRDHSFVAEAVLSGELSAEEAAQSQWRNAVTRVVGTDEVLEVDTFGPLAADVPSHLLLCSDGLYRFVTDEAMRRLVIAAANPAAAVRGLIDAALAGGSNDNISVVLLTIVPAAETVVTPSAAPAAQPTFSPTASPTVSPTAPAGVPSAARPGAAPAQPQDQSTRPPWPFELGTGGARVRKSRWTSGHIAVILIGIVLAILYAALLH